MRITITNCDVNLKANFGIDMQAIGSYDRLCAEMANRITYLGLEYDYPPSDYILLDVEDGMAIPDLSPFGEVQPYDNPVG